MKCMTRTKAKRRETQPRREMSYHIAEMARVGDTIMAGYIWGVTKAINGNGEHARITHEQKYKRGKSNILLKHNLNIISQSIGSQQTHHSNSIRITYMPRSCRAAHED